MKTNYLSHDRFYKANRKCSWAGWDRSEQTYADWQSDIERVLRSGHAPRSGKLLELGCGAGNMAIWFAGLGFHSYGIDISPAAIEWAKERAQSGNLDIEFEVGDAVTLSDYAASSFDFVFDGHCLHCIIGSDRSRLLSSVQRVLKPGGYLLIDTMCAPVDIDKLDPERAEHFDARSRCLIYDGVAVRYFAEVEEILAEVSAAELEILSYNLTEDVNDQPAQHLIIEAAIPSGFW